MNLLKEWNNQYPPDNEEYERNWVVAKTGEHSGYNSRYFQYNTLNLCVLSRVIWNNRLSFNYNNYCRLTTLGQCLHTC